MAFSSVLQMYLDWANSLLCEHGIVINELKEFQDGRIFALLIHILTDTQLFPSSEDGNDDEVSSLDRVQTILDYLLGLGVRLKVTATGMLNGELKCILDVIWAIILHFTIHSRDTPVLQKTVRNGKKLLLQWCTSQLGENALDVGKSLTQCFEKNNKLAELIGLFCSYSNSSTETYVNKLTSALIAAEDNFGIAKSLLSPADVIHGTIEEHALTIYIALLRRKVTMLGSENSQSEKSSDLNTSAGLPEGLTEEVANSLSQTFSFKFMRSPSQPIAPASHDPRPPSQSLSSPSSSPSSSSPSSNIAVNAPSIPRGQLPVKKLAASKIPVSSTRRQQQQTLSREDQSHIYLERQYSSHLPERNISRQHYPGAREQLQDWKGIDGKWSKGDGSFVDEEGGLLRKGTELSFVLPKGLDLSGGRGDELLAMLEAIGNEGRQLRQELNEAKAREDFLTKKLNERFSSQEEEVINRLVGELEMLRRENQRMFHELATARESASEDQKRCEKLQGAVDRLQMDVERLTAENFRLKFAAETGYEVTGEDLLAAMADSDIGFQLLPSPVMDRTNKNSQEDIPSPILTAQAEHESKLLAMRAETSSMRKLQELLTQAHAENRKLKAEQQERGRTCELEGEMSKVREELCQARSVGELLKEENTQLKGRMVKAKTEIEGLRQRFQEMEAEAQSKGTDSKNEVSAAGTETQTSQSNSSKDTKETGDSFSRKPKNKHNEEQLNSCFRAAPAEIAQGSVVDNKVTMGRNEFSVGAVNSTSHQSQRNVDGIAKLDRSHEARIHIDSTERDRLVDDASTSDSTGGTRKSKSSLSSVKSALTLSLSQHETASDKGESEGVMTGEEGNASSRVKESPGAVVDWKYLATSPGPATNSPCFSQLLASEQETETASEVESEAESRASDLFASSTVSSPVSKFLSSTKGRRASLGGLIVARAQNSPPGTHLESHSAIHPNVKEEDGTLIDKSYLDTTPDYFTADEGSVNRGHATNQTDNYSRPIISAPGSDTTLTPYHTPVNPRSRLKFSSLTNTLESLKSISRKAREDIETEVSVSDWSSQRETSQVKAKSMSSEQERHLIQEELCRIRLDNNIPGEKYPELGGEQRTSNGYQVTFSSRFLPRWRKFQYRRRRTNSNGPFKANDSATTGSRIYVHHMASSADMAVTNVSNIMDPYEHQIYGVGNVYNGHGVHGNGSPSRSSSDEYSDEYKPLPLELRQPRKLAEHSPSKTCRSFMPLGQKGRKGQNDEVSPSATGGKTLTVYAHDQISESSERDVPLFGPENGHHPQSDGMVGSSSEDIAASDSVSVVSSPMSKQSPSSVHPAADNGMPPGGLDTDAFVCSSRHQVNHSVTNASDGAEGEISGPTETLTTADLDALAERIILEGDSGVSLTSSIDLKSGLQSTYKHGLLTQEEQTYANALIAKYVHQLADK
ncbi:uncharacterized protein [Diadema antillarum]|uniref:uncharacterized protein n=1 Tax=Diadema antillarum TaxID=105358 RepID=UPI003A891A10